MSFTFYTGSELSDELHRYRICDRLFLTDYQAPALAPYSLRETIQNRGARCLTVPALLPSQRYFHGTVEVLQSHKTVSAFQSDNWVKLTIENTAGVFFRRSDSSCWLQTNAGQVEYSAILEFVVGPVLILPLAWNGIFCLHASAAMIDDQLCLFLGRSGAGKSTLVNTQETGWSRVADDIVPVTLESMTESTQREQEAHALPHFPQLKLNPEQQYGLAYPASAKIAHIFVLDYCESQSNHFKLDPLTTPDAALAVLKHTISSKIFPPQLLDEHLRFATRMADSSKMHRLQYARNMKLLPKLRQWLRKQITLG